MITLGIDLSSMPKDTAACCITWNRERAEVKSPVVHCTDEKLDALIAEADVIGIDAPFGWPDDFVAAVASWTSDSWSSKGCDRFQYRETDRMKASAIPV